MCPPYPTPHLRFFFLRSGSFLTFTFTCFLPHSPPPPRARAAFSLDFLYGVINDSGLLLDLLEQMEAEYAPALLKAADAAQQEITRSRSQAGGGGKVDEIELEEEDRAKMDLDAFDSKTGDIARARAELLKCGTQLTGIIVDLIFDKEEDITNGMAKLFTSFWDKANIATACCDIICQYLTEQRSLLDRHFYELSCVWILSALVAGYVVRLVSPDVAKSVFGVKYDGGFSSRFKCNKDRSIKIVADEMEITSRFQAAMSAPENVTLIVKPLHVVREFLTVEPDILIDSLESAIMNNSAVSTEVFMTFEKMLNLRDDIASDKKKRLALLEQGQQSLRKLGQPYVEADELLAVLDAYGHGVGVTSGACMAMGSLWTPETAANSIFRILFPTNLVMEKSAVYFKDWVEYAPAAASPKEESSPVSFNLAAFSAGQLTAVPLSSLGGGGSGSSSSNSSSSASSKAGGGLFGSLKGSSSSKPATSAAAAKPAPPPPGDSFLASAGRGGRRRRGSDDSD